MKKSHPRSKSLPSNDFLCNINPKITYRFINQKTLAYANSCLLFLLHSGRRVNFFAIASQLGLQPNGKIIQQLDAQF